MKGTPRFGVLIASGAVFLLAPYIPYSVLSLTVGNRIGAFVLLCLVIYTLMVDNILGLATFLAVAALFLEQRRRTVERVTKHLDPHEKPVFSVEKLNEPAPNIVPGEVHPPSKVAEVEDYSFEPTEDSGTNKYDTVDESINEKQPLETVPSQPNEVSDMLQAKGLAHIN
ncbi:MAG: hypothetical protein EBU66_06915 [Bacteroidetes bacterium]|jgi:hypothetical protein|nr:hypothetical protein [bacterium]NBP64392.1 hypothetical protein [Bacteroidota bacterium]